MGGVQPFLLFYIFLCQSCCPRNEVAKLSFCQTVIFQQVVGTLDTWHRKTDETINMSLAFSVSLNVAIHAKKHIENQLNMHHSLFVPVKTKTRVQLILPLEFAFEDSIPLGCRLSSKSLL